MKNNKSIFFTFIILLSLIIGNSYIAIAVGNTTNTDYMQKKEIAVLRSLDKTYATTSTFEVPVGQTVKFGKSLYIRPQICKKSPPTKPPESATFLQVWETPPSSETNTETDKKPESKWIFSGWMFASSPALSAMDHPIFDVWLIDCKNSKTKDKGKSKDKEELSPKPSKPAE